LLRSARKIEHNFRVRRDSGFGLKSIHAACHSSRLHMQVNYESFGPHALTQDYG